MMNTALTLTNNARTSDPRVTPASLAGGPFRNPQGTPFVRVQINGHFENWPINSITCERFIEHTLFRLTGEMPKKKDVNEIKRQWEGSALFEGEEHPTPLRVAAHAGNIYLDLCDPSWRAVEIAAQGWRLLDNPPVRFQRSPGMQALPAPIRGGSIQDLLAFFNIGDADQQLLLVAWMLAALKPNGPYPILAIKGQQGSAKSTLTKVVRCLIDPSDSPLRTMPRDERDLMISAKNAHLVGFDNLSSMPGWLSDGLCRLATGGGLATRQLYTDEKQMIFEATRPVFLNGITDLAERGDLLDRMVNLHLPTIPKHKRRDERDFWKNFEAARPALLGALLDAVCSAIRELHSVQLGHLPRMADFARWATAAEVALGFKPGDFVRAYERNRTESSLFALECAPVAEPIRRLLEYTGGVWDGTATQLLSRLDELAPDFRRDPEWPKSPKKMSAALDRAEPNLHVIGIKLTKWRKGGTGARMIRLEASVTPSALPSVS